MELTKKGKKVTLESDIQIAAYKKAGWVEVKAKKQNSDPAADSAEK
ncbi:hypothetical protein [Phascolarctobacterium faecium]